MGPVRQKDTSTIPSEASSRLVCSSARDFSQPDMASLMALQGFIHAATLGVASGECRAAHNVAALFRFLKDDFEIHDLSYDVGS